MKKLVQVLSIAAVATLLYSCSPSNQTAFAKRKYFDFKRGNTEVALNKPVTHVKEETKTQAPEVTPSVAPSENKTVEKIRTNEAVQSPVLGAVKTEKKKETFLNRSGVTAKERIKEVKKEVKTMMDTKAAELQAIAAAKHGGNHGFNLFGVIAMGCGIIGLLAAIIGFWTTLFTLDSERPYHYDAQGNEIADPYTFSTLPIIAAIILGIAGIALAIYSFTQSGNKGFGIIGLITGAVAIIVAIIVALLQHLANTSN